MNFRFRSVSAFCATAFAVCTVCPALVGGVEKSAPPTSSPTSASPVGERVPSDDAVLKDLHSLGLVDGHVNLFRCASPVRDIAKKMATSQPSEEQSTEARSRLQRLFDLGVRTDICLQDPDNKSNDEGKTSELTRSIALERAACEAVGIAFVSRPISNSGPHSLQTMSDAEVIDLLDEVKSEILADSKTGGVAFHCSAGHDRTGIVAAYIRMKIQHWPVDEAIAEMRRYGHNWVKYSSNGGESSWHEEHLRHIAELLANQVTSK